jgi:mono/diheme cytochrome c family protein
MSRRAVRLILVPAVLLVIVSGAVFGLAQWHPAKQESRTQTSIALLGDPVRGEQLFAQHCQTCHGEGGSGGDVGPRLAGNEVSIDDARSTIENGSGVMPAGLVTGQDLEDVLAYLETILGSTSE